MLKTKELAIENYRLKQENEELIITLKNLVEIYEREKDDVPNESENTPIDYFINSDISARLSGCLRTIMSQEYSKLREDFRLQGFDDIKTIGELASIPDRIFLRIPNFGRKSLREMRERLEKFGIKNGKFIPTLHKLHPNLY